MAKIVIPSFSIFQKTFQWFQNQNIEVYGFENDFPSTQIWALNQSRNLTIPCAVLARKQIQGIGRRNNTWLTPEEDKGLQITFVFKQNSKPIDLLSFKFGFLLIECVSKIWPGPWGLKPPNDLFLDKKNVQVFSFKFKKQGMNKLFLLD